MFESRNYYHCLISGLPDLFLDETEVHFSLLDFKNNLADELYEDDYKLARKLFLPYDNKNLLNILQEQYDQHDPLGNYTLEEMERELDEEEALGVWPAYMYDFARRYREDKNSRTLKQWENELTGMYLDHMLDLPNAFLREWYTFEMHVTNLLTGINCRKFERDPEEELIGDNFVTQAIKHSSAKDFGLEVELEYTGQVLNIAEKENLLAREKSLDQFKWEQLNHFTLFHYFSMEVVLAYIMKLKMIYRWMKLDEKTGREMIESLISELKESFEFSKEFLINEQKR
ncbi:MAG: DUF2764 family protein [Bacteroidales bacterium]|nr:DUF2764 family protein [Bacteroidales bacterium]